MTLITGLGVRQGHWKCHHWIERVLLTFYSNYGSISRVVSEIFNVEKYRDLEIPVKIFKVIESGTIRYTGYGLLLVLYSNLGP